MNSQKKLPKIIKEFSELSQTLVEFKELVKDWNGHYSTDNITMRDNWMRGVDNKEHCLEEQSNKLGDQLEKLNKKIDKIIVFCNTVATKTTKGDISVEICAKCHPFFTGKQKFVDAGGRVDKFKKRLNNVK